MRILSWKQRKPESDVFIVQVEPPNAAQPDKSRCRECFSVLWKCVALALVFLVIGCTLNVLLYERLEVYEEFWTFTEVYGKEYDSIAEMDQAFDFFRENYLELKREMANQPDVKMGFHPWMDQHFSTFREKFALGDIALPPMEGLTPFSGFEEKVNRPAEYSLRDKATPVKNQGSCGSCWAFATVASVETANVLAGNALVALSEQEMIECDTRNTGCRGGVRTYAMSFVVQNGLVPESTYPYTAKEGEQCHINANATKVHIKDFRLLSTSEDAMADWLFKTGPITFGMNVTQSMFNYRSGVFRPTEADCQTKSQGSHAMTILGYGSERGQDYWLVKNSWGDFWGDGGYFKLARGANVCGMANNVVAPIFK